MELDSLVRVEVVLRASPLAFLGRWEADRDPRPGRSPLLRAWRAVHLVKRGAVWGGKR